MTPCTRIRPGRQRRDDGPRVASHRRILERQELDLPVLVGIAEYEGAIEKAIQTALELLDGCRMDLDVLAPSEYKDALTQITRFLETLLRKCRS